tara:strand:+ start:241 stop:717 length:477 start_codon:yes stop_codon:yes gene_type:complete
MAVNVNPPPQLKIPQAFLKDREVKAFIEQQNTIIFQLYKRTGGTDDSIDDSQQNITSSSSRVSRNSAKINSLELKEFEIVNTTVDVVAEEFQIIICKNSLPITVTLDQRAIENDEVHIKRRGESIEVIGSIDGFTNKTINVINYSMHLIYDGTDWSEI